MTSEEAEMIEAISYTIESLKHLSLGHALIRFTITTLENTFKRYFSESHPKLLEFARNYIIDGHTISLRLLACISFFRQQAELSSESNNVKFIELLEKNEDPLLAQISICLNDVKTRLEKKSVKLEDITGLTFADLKLKKNTKN